MRGVLHDENLNMIGMETWKDKHAPNYFGGCALDRLI